MASQRAFQLADQITKNIISGYCRDAQQSLGSDQIIPIQIVQVILAFYYIVERFVECGNERIVFHDEGMRIVNGTNEYDSAYGVFEIDCDKEKEMSQISKHRLFKWVFDIIKDGQRCVTIGIDETKREGINLRFHERHESVNYSFRAGRLIYRKLPNLLYRNKEVNHGYYAGDSLTMILNLKEKALYYHVKTKENEAKMIIIKDIETENVTYCAAVYLWGGAEVRLTKFSVEDC